MSWHGREPIAVVSEVASFLRHVQHVDRHKERFELQYEANFEALTFSQKAFIGGTLPQQMIKNASVAFIAPMLKSIPATISRGTHCSRS